MARAIWTGTLSFGLVTIPVKLYPAVRRKAVRFNQLDGADNARIQQKRVNSVSGEEVPFERLVKGYELTPDRYVVVTQEELDSLDPERSRTIEIEDFVDAGQIDPVHYDTTYFVVPAEGGAKPYRLLLEAMAASDRVGIARIVLRTKQYLAAVRPAEGALELSTMLFADELVKPGTLEELGAVGEISTAARELQVAEQLIGSLSTDFDPARYRDEHRERVMELIERKAQGEQIEIPATPEAASTPVPDLMSALKASLDAVRGQDAGKPKPGAAAKKPAAAKKSSAAAKKPAAGAKKPARAK